MKMSQLKIYIPENLHIDFKVRCVKNNTNMTQVVGDLISAYLSKDYKEVA